MRARTIRPSPDRSWVITAAAVCTFLTLAPLFFSNVAAAKSGIGFTRALILGGGGATGRAWEIGVLKGLHDAGIELAAADLIVGTSAGAVLGAQVRAGHPLEEMYRELFAAPDISAPRNAYIANQQTVDQTYWRETSQLWQGVPEPSLAVRLDVGRRALAATNVTTEDDSILAASARGGISEWPERLLRMQAVDVVDGSIRFIDGTQGVPISRALAASTASPGAVAPITIGDRRYMDGGVSGNVLGGADGYDVVVVLAPTGNASRLDQAADAMRSQGTQIMVVTADPESASARGSDNSDLNRVQPAGEAGLRQSAVVATDVRRVWTSTGP